MGETADEMPAGLEGSGAVFDRATRLARALFGRVAAQITLQTPNGLWRSRRQPGADPGQGGAVAEVMRLGQLLWVEDCTTHPRFENDPMVAGPPHIRFLAGAPIRLEDGSTPGAILVAGLEPRGYDRSLGQRLQDLADFVADEWTRVRAEKALVEALERSERSEARLKLAAEIADLHVFELDNARREVTTLGAEANFFETPPTYESLTEDVWSTIDPRDRGSVVAAWERHMAGDGPYRPEYRVARSDGKEVWVASSVLLVTDDSGEPLRIVGALQNITGRKQTELALVQAKDDAEAANRAKSAFLATMSHEIRTPLNGVLGMAQAMAKDGLEPVQRERLGVIRQSAESLLAILNDVLDLSKVEAGKLELEHAAFDLDDLARTVHATFGALADAKGLDFELVVEKAASGFYEGDAVRVRQIFWNLIGNAVKFTAQGAVRVHVGRRKGLLRITVADTGIGISADQVSGVFRKFEQADASTTRRFGGTGLGLAISRELADLMGGSISVDSAPGAGATFEVILPLRRLSGRAATAARQPLPAEPTPACIDRPIRVLAAEDNSMNQLELKTLLGQVGVEPVIVSDGAQAVEAWSGQAWDVILMDVQMPVMDGPTATAIIRGRERAEGRTPTPIIALTANAMSHQVAEYLACGMDAVVPKPIEAMRLYEALQVAIDGTSSLDVAAA
jgi:signal transduction histidine kinase